MQMEFWGCSVVFERIHQHVAETRFQRENTPPWPHRFPHQFTRISFSLPSSYQMITLPFPKWMHFPLSAHMTLTLCISNDILINRYVSSQATFMRMPPEQFYMLMWMHPTLFQWHIWTRAMFHSTGMESADLPPASPSLHIEVTVLTCV